ILIRKIVIVVGVEHARALLQQVLSIEAAGGRMTLDGTRRKTPGGLFISLARAQASETERPRLYQPGRKKRPVKPAAEQPSPAATVSPSDTPVPSDQTPAPSPAPQQAKPTPAPSPAP